MTPATAMMVAVKRYLLLAVVTAAAVRWLLDRLDLPGTHQ